MKLLFKQRFFSWFDSYDIYDESGATRYVVKGQFALGHHLNVFDAQGNVIGHLKQRVFHFLPHFDIYLGERLVGTLVRRFTFFKPQFDIDYNGWHIEGDWFEWDYVINDAQGSLVATLEKKIWNWTDTYVMDIQREEDALGVLMVVLAIDAIKCSQQSAN